MILAVLVILAHSPELVDGNRSREILTRIFGTLSLGDVGVDGFFLLSGFLITKSFQRSPTLFGYVTKRVARIYPGFVVAFLMSLLVVAPLAGVAPLSFAAVAAQVPGMAMLQEPLATGAFAGLPHPQLDGSLWTIGYEFRCYGLVLVAGLLGVLRRKFLCLTLVATMVGLSLAQLDFGTHVLWQVTGNLNVMLRFGMLFGCGALFHLFDGQVRYTRGGAIAAAMILCAALFSPRCAEPGLAIAGGYVLFYLAFHCNGTRYNRIGDRADLSYGTYLYAWPIQNLLIYWFHGISPWALDLIALPASLLLATASWYGVERPFMRLSHSRPKVSWVLARG